MLTTEQIEQFKTDGYLRSGRVISDEQVETLRDEMARVIADHGKPDVPQPVSLTNLNGNPETPVWQIINIWEASEPYRELMSNPIITEEMAQLTGASTLRIWHDQIQYKPASTGGTNMWHQDAPLWPTIAPMTEVSAWVALDDVDEANGCMWMVPGSHLWGNQVKFWMTLKNWEDLPDIFEGHRIETRVCPVKKGEVHYHHALTWHGSPPNTSPRPRRAIAIHYMTEVTRYVGNGGHIMEPFVEVQEGDMMQGKHFPVVWTMEN
jgi:ectoine hydroxylase-related dioxygenase (phytanoyl-CoA dioxygenase family)